MTPVKKGLLKTLIVYVSIYITTVTFFFFTQEKFFFHPQKLKKDHKFNFPVKFEELNITAVDDTVLNGVIFKADSAKGLVFYLHGNMGCLKAYIDVAKVVTGLKYDLFVLDYRGYGKSGGSIESQGQLFNDIQIAYNKLKSRYSEDKIIVYGYSIGSGPAVWLASTNSPRLLILQAAYYSFQDLFFSICPVIPPFLLKYKFETNKYITSCEMPIIMFHGDKDRTVYYNSSVKLKKLTKPGDRLITIYGFGHTDISGNQQYLSELEKILK